MYHVGLVTGFPETQRYEESGMERKMASLRAFNPKNSCIILVGENMCQVGSICFWIK